MKNSIFIIITLFFISVSSVCFASCKKIGGDKLFCTCLGQEKNLKIKTNHKRIDQKYVFGGCKVCKKGCKNTYKKFEDYCKKQCKKKGNFERVKIRFFEGHTAIRPHIKYAHID